MCVYALIQQTPLNWGYTATLLLVRLFHEKIYCPLYPIFMFVFRVSVSVIIYLFFFFFTEALKV